MKDLKYYEERNKALLEEQIKLDLKIKPVQISIDCTIETEKDLKTSSVKFAIRRQWRRQAQVDFEKAKRPTHRFLKCAPGTKLNGIPLDDGIILPLFAPEVLEDHELTVQMMREGLILSLQQEYDSYYQKLLLSFDLSDLPEQIQSAIKAWGSRKEKKS